AIGRQIAHAHGARCLRLRHADDLDQAHAAIAGDGKPLVEAKARNLRARGLARLEQGVLRRNVDLFAVDDELGHTCRPFVTLRALRMSTTTPGIARTLAKVDVPQAA